MRKLKQLSAVELEAASQQIHNIMINDIKKWLKGLCDIPEYLKPWEEKLTQPADKPFNEKYNFIIDQVIDNQLIGRATDKRLNQLLKSAVIIDKDDIVIRL
jgi:hypothetical protein